MSRKRKSPSSAVSMGDLLGDDNALHSAPSYPVEVIKAKERKWSDLSDEIAQRRATVVEHKYVVEATDAKEKLRVSHAHNEFYKRIKAGELSTHNIATTKEDTGSRSFPKLAEALDEDTGAKDALRVLKGTHQSKGLVGATQKARQDAVELAAEIGISEYTRGTNAAVADAAVSLYRVKHGSLELSEFASHQKGYSGAEDGGADRVRKHTSVSDAFTKHNAALLKHFNDYAAHKDVRPWEAILEEKGLPKTAANKFAAWKAHKAKKWTGRT